MPLPPATAHELLAMMQTDQRLRRAAIDRQGGLMSLDSVTAHKIEQMDRAHADRLAQIIDEYGWPNAAECGPEVVNAAWLIAQHADHDAALQRRCLDAMPQPGGQEATDLGRWAMLTDRVELQERGEQIYGTQWVQDASGDFAPLPIAEPDDVDDRRAEVGLDSLELNRARIAAMHDTRGR